jgi:hypothetical protein
MAGEIKRMIDRIIEERAQGNPALVSSTRIKLVMKGIHPDRFDPNSDDDPAVMGKLQKLAQELGLTLA